MALKMFDSGLHSRTVSVHSNNFHRTDQWCIDRTWTYQADANAVLLQIKTQHLGNTAQTKFAGTVGRMATVARKAQQPMTH